VLLKRIPDLRARVKSDPHPQRDVNGRITSERKTKKRGRLSTHPLSCSGDKPDQVQTITPVALAQVLADCEWTAVALQVCGGPAVNVAVIVTFCEGVKP
jgi:hypothetical protein